MLMRKLVYVVLLIILGGCISPSPSLEDIHQRVAKQVEVLIDSGYLLTTYIEIDEVFSTDSNSLYYIGESDSPGSDGASLSSDGNCLEIFTEPDLYTRYIFRSVCRTQSVLLRLYICTDILHFIHEQYKGCQISHKIGTVFSSPTDRNSGKYLYHSTLWGVSVPTVLPGNWSTALLPVHGGAPAKSDGV